MLGVMVLVGWNTLWTHHQFTKIPQKKKAADFFFLISPFTVMFAQIKYASAMFQERWKHKQVKPNEINGTLLLVTGYVMRCSGPEKHLRGKMAVSASPCKRNEAK